MPIRILLADDHQIIRDGLRALLEKKSDNIIVGEAETGEVALKLARELSPHLIIMDVSMPDLNGIETTRKIIRELPGIKVIALSMHADKKYVSEMLSAGASGYLLKDCAFKEVSVAIETVMRNRKYLSPAITGVVLDDYVSKLETEQAIQPSKLSPKEKEILQLIAEGHTTKEIAVRLNVSGKTIDTHRQSIMTKLNLHSIADLTKYAIREGLTSLE